MSKTKKLRKKFTAFASQLSPDECREQLVLAYLQMEKCLQVLRGEDVEPVAMKDNGESSDLELFYMCKKVREELDYLNDDDLDEDNVIQIAFTANSPQEMIGKLEDFAKDPKAFIEMLKKSRSDGGYKYSNGDEVWYVYEDLVQHGYIHYRMKGEDGETCYKTSLDHTVCECDVFSSLDELFSYLKDNINE